MQKLENYRTDADFRLYDTDTAKKSDIYIHIAETFLIGK
jgi:hypothetical protein